MIVYLRGPLRTAGLHVLANTPLGGTVERVGSLIDDGDLLSIDVLPEARPTLSTGEQALLKFLASLAGQDAVNLWALLNAVDRDCQLVCVWSLGLATGHFAAMTPVHFGAPSL